jgi:hypothetical protein
LKLHVVADSGIVDFQHLKTLTIRLPANRHLFDKIGLTGACHIHDGGGRNGLSGVDWYNLASAPARILTTDKNGQQDDKCPGASYPCHDGLLSIPKQAFNPLWSAMDI